METPQHVLAWTALRGVLMKTKSLTFDFFLNLGLLMLTNCWTFGINIIDVMTPTNKVNVNCEATPQTFLVFLVGFVSNFT